MNWKIITIAGFAVIAVAILMVSASAHPNGQSYNNSNSASNGPYYGPPGYYRGFEGERGGDDWRAGGMMNSWGSYASNYNGTGGGNFPAYNEWGWHE